MIRKTGKSTYSLDAESLHILEALAKRWKVSESEGLHRAIRIAATEGETASRTALAALDQLQSSLRLRKVDLAAWEQEVRSERCAAVEFGFRPFPKRGRIVTNEVIDRLRGESREGPTA